MKRFMRSRSASLAASSWSRLFGSLPIQALAGGCEMTTRRTSGAMTPRTQGASSPASKWTWALPPRPVKALIRLASLMGKERVALVTPSGCISTWWKVVDPTSRPTKSVDMGCLLRRDERSCGDDTRGRHLPVGQSGLW